MSKVLALTRVGAVVEGDNKLQVYIHLEDGMSFNASKRPEVVKLFRAVAESRAEIVIVTQNDFHEVTQDGADVWAEELDRQLPNAQFIYQGYLSGSSLRALLERREYKDCHPTHVFI